MERLNKFDAWLMNHKPNARLSGASRLLTEFWFFGLKKLEPVYLRDYFLLRCFRYQKRDYGAYLVMIFC